jgi:periodic tryptophan protein 1
LEVHVYEQKTGNFFVHHDIPLPAFPLCLAHGDISPQGSAGNFCAVGTFLPGIEIWNLDVLNALEPSCVLGGEDTSMADDIMRHNIMNSSNKNKKKLKLGRGPSLRAGSHTDAVMSVSWNKIHRQVIASGSADCTVKLWDVTKANTDQCNASTYTHHKDKVQAVLWHPKEGTLLATGSYDRRVALVDVRSQENIKKVKIPGDCEALAWDPFTPEYLTAASEDGSITCWDVRKFSDKTPLWSIVANEFGGVSDLSYNPSVPGMLATCSVDKTITLWDTYNSTENPTTGPPKVCGSKDMGVGKLYTVNFYPSSPWLMGCAGGGKELAIWDMTRETSIQKRFVSRMGSETVTESAETAPPTDTKESFAAMMSPQPNTETTDPVEPTKEAQKSKTKKGNSNKKAHKAGR